MDMLSEEKNKEGVAAKQISVTQILQENGEKKSQKNEKKNEKKWTCEKCNRDFKYKSWLVRHLTTCNDIQIPIQPIKTKMQLYMCANCGKQYKYKSSYDKHIAENKCSKEAIVEDNDYKMKMMDLLKESTKTNRELCEKIKSMEKDNQQFIQNNITNTKIDNSKSVNINVFLNEECKNAMNLTDFASQIQLSIEDLMYTKDNGYVKGISNIFIKGLEDIGVNERPIHCSNMRSLKFYVKDENEWDLDNENKKLDKTIDYVAKKQIHQIKDWEADHPNWNETDEGTNDYLKMIQTIMGGSDENERQKNKDLIKKKLTESVEISKRIKSLKN